MVDRFRPLLERQFHAALSMLAECLHRCPDEHWDGPIARYPFWLVAYHTLCMLDFHLAPSEAAWRPRTGPGGMHPAGFDDLAAEYPSRRFTRDELLGYAAICRQLVTDALAAETAESLAGDCGFPSRGLSRAELHLYNLRHVQHHTGQLSAYLHRAGVGTGWIASGWREPGGA